MSLHLNSGWVFMDPKVPPPVIATGLDRSGERHQGKRRSRTIAARRLGKVDFSDGMPYEADLEEYRPASRNDCIDGPRPCPWISCKYHLYLDVNPRTGSIKLNFPDIEPWEMIHSCVLDIADRGPVTLEDVGRIMNLTRERIRQLEASASTKIRSTRLAQEYSEFVVERPTKAAGTKPVAPAPVRVVEDDEEGEDAD
jgi:hypothetical protein